MAQMRISIVFESGARIDPSKAKLLESIRRLGALRRQHDLRCQTPSSHRRVLSALALSDEADLHLDSWT
jgi:hypothetical protein